MPNPVVFDDEDITILSSGSEEYYEDEAPQNFESMQAGPSNEFVQDEEPVPSASTITFEGSDDDIIIWD